MSNILNFINIQKYIHLHTFFKNNNLPNDIFIYIVDISIPFEKHTIDQICESIICFSNDHGIFLCNNIFDKMTYAKYHDMINVNNVNMRYLEYCIIDDIGQYTILYRCYNKAYNIFISKYNRNGNEITQRKSKYKYNATFFTRILK